MKMNLLTKSLAVIFGIMSAISPVNCSNKDLKKFFVTTTKDHGRGSLRDAIKKANKHGSSSIIRFCLTKKDKGYNPCNKSWCIRPCKELPAIHTQVCIDGHSQKGARSNTNAIACGNNVRINIELCGPGLDVDSPTAGIHTHSLGWTGLTFAHDSYGSSVKGLAINDFPVAIEIAAKRVKVKGCFLGVSLDGYTAQSNLVSVYVDASANQTLIGGSKPRYYNLICGLGRASSPSEENNDECLFSNLGAITNLGDCTKIKGCTLNLTRDGYAALTASAEIGIYSFGNKNTVIGGKSEDCRVVSSGHTSANILCDSTINDTLQNVFAGTDVTGTAGIGGGAGIVFTNSCDNSDSKTEEEYWHLMEDCLTSGHQGSGIVVGRTEDSYPVRNLTLNRCKSGSDCTGVKRLPNDDHGMSIGYGIDTTACDCVFNFNRTHGVFAPRCKRTIIKDSDVSFNEVDGYNYIPEACLNSDKEVMAALSSLVAYNVGGGSCACYSFNCGCYYFDSKNNKVCC